MKKVLFLLVLSLVPVILLAQNLDDYRSAATGNWNAAATWQRFDGIGWVAAPGVPSSANGVITIQNTHVVTANTVITADQVVVVIGGTLIISGSTFTVNDGPDAFDISAAGSLQIIGSILSGTGATAVSGTMLWTAGTIDAPVNITSGATLTVNTATTKNLNDVLTIEPGGIMNWDNGNINFSTGTLANNGTINNSFAGVLNPAGGTNTFSNSSVFNKSGVGITTCNLNVSFNTGTMNINSGTFTYGGGSTAFTNSGTINIGGGATLSSGSTNNNYNTGTILSGTGTFALANGNNIFNDAISSPAGLNVALAGAIIVGPGSLTVNGTMAWTAGTIDGPVNIASGGVLTANGGSSKSMNDTLTIQSGGTMNWDASSIILNSGTLTNSGIFNLSFGGTLTNGSGVNTFTNTGTGVINKSGIGVGGSSVATTSNAGTINVNGGTFTIAGTTFTNTGTINIGTGNFFSASSTNSNFNAGTTFTGLGTLTLQTANHNFNVAISSPVGLNVALAGGIIVGPGSLTVNGTMAWTAGTIDGPVNIASGAVLTVNGGANKSMNDVLTIQSGGIMNWDATLIILNSGTLTNSGTFNISFAVILTNGSGTNIFTNTITGVINKSGIGVGGSSVTTTSNAGTINVNSGTYSNAGTTFTNTGTINIGTGNFFSASSTNSNFNAGTTFTGLGTLTLQTGNHNFNVAISSAVGLNVALAGGIIADTTGSLTINDSMFWTAGTIDGPVNIASGAVLTVNGGANKSMNDVLTIQSGGTMNWDASLITLNSGTLTNDGTFNINFAVILTNGSGTNIFTNTVTGVINKNGIGIGGSSVTTTSNAGTINVNGGTYNNAGTLFTNTGTINIGSGNVFGASSTNSNFNAGTTFTGLGTLNLVSGNHNFNVAISSPVGLNVALAGGIIAGPGSLTVNGTMAWTTGTIDGAVNIASGGVLTVTGGSSKNLNDVLTIQPVGIMNWDGGNIALNTGTLTNNGTFNSNSAGQLNNGTGLNVFTNAGIFNKGGGGVTSIFIATTSNSGTGIINVNSGNLSTIGTVFTNTGTINIGTGNYFITQSVNSNFNTGTTFTGLGTLNLQTGNHNFNDAISIPAGFNDSLSGGVIAGTGSLTVNGTMTWAGGTINRPVNIVSGAVLTVNGGATKLLNDSLTILFGAIMNWSAGIITLNSGTLTNDGTINNSFAGTASLNNGTGSNVFTNAGVFNKNGVGVIDCYINTVSNAGIINVNGGTFNSDGATFTNTGTINIGTGNFFTASSTNNNFNTGTIFTGLGTLHLQVGNNHNFNDAISSPAAFNDSLSGGVIAGTGSLTVNGTMAWTAGTIDGPVNIASGGVLTINGGATKNLNDVLTIQTGGIMNWDAGTITLNSGTLTNNGTINNSFAANLNNGTGTNIFNNALTGIYRKTDVSITNWGLPVVNSGSIAGTGTISITGTFTNNGSISPGLSPGVLIMNSTPPLFSGSSSLTIEVLDGSGVGTGHDQLQRAGNLTLNGTLNVTQTGSVPPGTYVIISLSSGTISSNFSTVNLPSGYSLSSTATTVSITKASLPVKLISFNAQVKNNGIELSWQTASEANSSYFAVERSKEGTLFTEIGRISAAGNSQELRKYQFNDEQPWAAANYYRLKQVDADEKFEYSKVVRVNVVSKNTIVISPNPAQNFFMLEGNVVFKQIQLLDINGRSVKYLVPGVNKQYDISSLEKGLYILRMTSENGVQVMRLLKQ